MPQKSVVVAIPVFNEQEVIPELLRRLSAAAQANPSYAFSFLFVDDGSTDSTFALLADAARADTRIEIIRLSRNFGHQAALVAAIDHADGDALIMMDGDLQDTPETIAAFLAEMERGADVVYAIRKARKESLMLRGCYAVFYRLLSRLSNVEIPLDSGDFSLITRRVANTLRSLPEHHRFLRGLRAWTGFKQIGIPVERAARHAGDRKYTLAKLTALATDGVFSFSFLPLRAATVLGTLVIGMTLIYSAYVLASKLLGSSVPQGFSAIFLTNVLLAGVQFLFLGVIGEYVGRIYEECKRRPLYVIDTVVKR